MTLRLLIDENVDPDTVSELRSRGHDAVAVRDADELGTGTLDGTIIEHAQRHGYAVVTGDKGFIEPANRSDVAVVFCQDDDLKPQEIGELIDELDEYVPSQADLSSVYHLKREYLR